MYRNVHLLSLLYSFNSFVVSDSAQHVIFETLLSFVCVCVCVCVLKFFSSPVHAAYTCFDLVLFSCIWN